MFGSTDFSATPAPSFFTSWHRHAAAEGLGTVVFAFSPSATTCLTGTFHFRNKSFLFFNTVSVFGGPATHDTTPKHRRAPHHQLIVDRHDGAVAEKMTTEFWVSAALLAQLFAVGLNASRMLANFFCRSIRSAKIRACTVSYSPVELTVIQEVALTVTGHPLTILVIATGAHGCLSGGAGNNAGREQRTQIKCSHAPPHTDDLSN